MAEEDDGVADSAAGSEVDQPGLGALREAVASYAARRLPGRPEPRQDGIAGLNVAVANVPDGLANGLLVGVSPVFGLYATMAGPLVGGLFSSTQLMVVTTTAAASLTAGQALGSISPGDRAGALFVMVVLVGAIQIAAGLLGLGRLIRFVSFSVVTGFLTAIAALLVLSQLPTVAGYEASGGNRVTQTLDLVAHAGELDPWSLGLAALTLALAVVLPRTPVGNAGRLLAIVIPSLLLALVLDAESVRIVGDVGHIPQGLPSPVIPDFAAAIDMFTGALSVAVIVLVQGAGVSQSVPNPNGTRSDTSRDFIAQGGANIVSGFFRGLPVGGSASATALNVVSGARTRWAVIFAGLWMAVIVVGAPGLVSRIAMPALGALLVLAGLSSIKPGEIASVWRAGWTSRLAAGTTFLAALFLPIQAAVGLGVVLAALLYVSESSTDISVVELVERGDGRVEEREPPRKLPSGAVTVLDVYGHLFFAGARTLESLLPDPRGAKSPAVVLRLRGRTAVGATLVDVLARYAEELEEAGGRLYLAGLSKDVHRHVARGSKLRLSGPVRIYEATPVVGESTRRAYEDAQSWLVETGASETRS
jgi:SulP family sulfate permease